MSWLIDMEDEMPERINVMKVVTYDVQEVINTIKDARNNDEEVTMDDGYGVRRNDG